MTGDRIQHALDTIYEKVFNLGQADLYPGLVSGPYIQHNPLFRMGSMPSWATSSRPGAYPARSNASPSIAIWPLYTCVTWTGQARKPRVSTSSASTRTARWSSIGTCCSQYQLPRTTPTRCSRESRTLRSGVLQELCHGPQDFARKLTMSDTKTHDKAANPRNSWSTDD
jgi:hypothetical protein